MTWLNPWMGLWSLLAVPVILLYVLRVRRRRLSVPTLLFWDEVFEESKPRAWWQQFRHLISLLLQLALLAFVIAALADPLTAGQSSERRLWILLVDRSASMRCPVDIEAIGSGTRLVAVVDEARGIAGRMREWDEAMVVAFSDDAQVMCGRTDDPGSIMKALAAITASDRPGDIARAVAFARSVRAGERILEIVLCTDPQGAAAVEDRGDLRIVTAGHPAPNLGITAFATRPVGESRDRQRILLRVLNNSPTNQSCSVSLRANDEPFDSVFMDLGANTSMTAVVETSLPTGGVVEATFTPDGPDALAADNRAFLAVPPPTPLRIAIVGAGSNLFLREVFSAQPLVRVTHLAPAQADGLTTKQFDVVVFHGHVPEALPPINSLYLSPEQDSELWSLGDTMTNMFLHASADDSPLLRHVSLEQIIVRQARALGPRGGLVLLRSLETPVAAMWWREGHKVLAVSIDLERSDLPLRTTFPIFVANAIRWFEETTTASFGSFQTGNLATLRARRTSGLVAMDPEGNPVPVSETSGQVQAGPLESVGIYTLADATTGDVEQRFSANLLHEKESTTFPQDADALSASETSASIPKGRPIWFILTLLAFALCLIEWGLHHRRVVE